MEDTTTTTLKTEYRYRISILIANEEDRVNLDAIFHSFGVTPIQERHTEKIHLAYPIQKQSYAFLIFFECGIEPDVMRKISHAFQNTKGVLRHVVHKIKGSGARMTPSRTTPRSSEKVSRPVRKPSEPMLTNEDLEKKIEEILQ